MKRRVGIAIVTIVLSVLLSKAIIAQVSGSLDPNFGAGGVVAANLPGSSRAAIRKIAVQSDGSVVALFDDTDSSNNFRLALGRFLDDGSVDPGFGTGGFVYSPWPTAGYPYPRNIGIQLDGKIVVCGMAQLGRNALAARFERYNSDGSIDSSFGSAGVVSIDVTGPDAMAIQPDGKILAMNQDGKLMRLNLNGSLDSSFGSGGIASPKLALAPWFNGLLVLASGKIVATGRTTVANVTQFTVAGYNSNGSLDDGGKSDSTPGNQFGSGGKTLISFAGYSGGRGYDINLDPSGNLVVLGAAGTQNNALGLARLSPTGQMDNSFGTGGRVVFSDPNGLPQGTAMGIQSDGRIVVIGGYHMGVAPDGTPLRDAMVVRFTASGSLDSFDVGQFVLTDTFGADDLAYDGSVRVDPGCQCERILWTGASYANSGTGFVPTPMMLQFVP